MNNLAGSKTTESRRDGIAVARHGSDGAGIRSNKPESRRDDIAVARYSSAGTGEPQSNKNESRRDDIAVARYGSAGAGTRSNKTESRRDGITVARHGSAGTSSYMMIESRQGRHNLDAASISPGSTRMTQTPAGAAHLNGSRSQSPWKRNPTLCRLDRSVSGFRTKSGYAQWRDLQFCRTQANLNEGFLFSSHSKKNCHPDRSRGTRCSAAHFRPQHPPASPGASA
jgi:hypothetical protein